MGVGAQNSLGEGGEGEITFAQKLLRQLLQQMHNFMLQFSASIFNVQIRWTLVYAVKTKTCVSELIFTCKQEIPLKNSCWDNINFKTSPFILNITIFEKHLPKTSETKGL